MPGASEILLTKYGVEIDPGKSKVECPECGHKTLSIKDDDSIAKCWHPSCTFRVSMRSVRGIPAAVDWLFRCMLNDCRADLQQFKGFRGRSPYSYLTNARRVHPSVVEHSAIGSVPKDYVLQEYQDEGLKMIMSDESSTSEAKMTDQDDFEGFCGKLEDLLAKLPGWIVFFYEDAPGRLVSVKLRKPYTKKILTQKPLRTAGVFLARHSDRDSPRLLVTEGEFNALSLKSLELRFREETKAGLLPEEYTVGAVGGVTTADWATVARIDSNPVVCYDNDASEAGLDLVTQGQKHVPLTAFTTPDVDTDLDEYIRSFRQDPGEAGKGVQSLFGGRVHYERDYESVAKQVDGIRQNDKLNAFMKNRYVGETIIDDLCERGRFYHDRRQGYVFLHSRRTLIPLERDNPQYRLLISRYGINGAEHVFKFVFNAANVHALENGEITDLYRFSHYDSSGNRLYLYNNNSRIFRIEADSVELVDNGTDGVLFLDDPHGEPFRIVEVPAQNSPLDQFLISLFNVSRGFLTVGEAKLLLTVWFYSLFFEDILQSKPLLILLGPKGSGKTNSLRSIGSLLVGKRFGVTPLSNDEKDFDAAVTNSFLVVLDNVDAAPKWLDDRLATSATGGSLKRRELYTTNHLVEFVVKCYIAISARTPRFRRDDVADRLLILHVDRIINFESLNILRENLTQNRDLVMSEVVIHLQEILRSLAEHGAGINVGSFRMADFAEFALRISKAHGIENKMRSILKKVSREQSAFTLDADSIVELLVDLASRRPDQEYDAAQLCERLTKSADRRGIEFKYAGNPRGLAQRLRNIETDLDEYVKMTTREGSGRKRFYRFESVADGDT